LEVGHLVGHLSIGYTAKVYIIAYCSSPYMSGFMITVCVDGSMCMSDSLIVTSAQIVCSIESALSHRSLDVLVRDMPIEVAGQDSVNEVINTACRFEE
jgi:hypothetical protein